MALTGTGSAHPEVYFPMGGVTAGGKYFFTAVSGSTGELWVIDGTDLRRLTVFESPQILMPPPPGDGSGDSAATYGSAIWLRWLTGDGVRAYLVAPTLEGNTIWASDGT